MSFERGSTIRFRLAPKDFDGNPIIPTVTPTCKIFNPDNPQVPTVILTVETYGTGQFQAYWTIPSDLPISSEFFLPKIYYAEWAWEWSGFAFIKRVPFDVLHVDATMVADARAKLINRQLLRQE